MAKSKKLLLLALALAAAAALTVFCLTPAKRAPRPEPATTVEETGVTLSNAEKITDILRQSLRAHDKSVTLKFTASGEYMEDISPLVSGLVESALSHTGEPDEGDYLRYQYAGYTLSYSHEAQTDGNYLYTVKIEPEYYADYEQNNKAEEAVSAALKELRFNRFTTEEEKIAAIYDYVCNHVVYDKVHSGNRYFHLKSTAYAALCRGSAACQGYSVVIYRLMLESGIDCRILTGTVTDSAGNTELHSWNIVRLGDVYYNLDAAWGSRTGDTTWYMKSDASFADHIRDAQFDTAAFRAYYPMAETDR